MREGEEVKTKRGEGSRGRCDKERGGKEVRQGEERGGGGGEARREEVETEENRTE